MCWNWWVGLVTQANVLILAVVIQVFLLMLVGWLVCEVEDKPCSAKKEIYCQLIISCQFNGMTGSSVLMFREFKRLFYYIVKWKPAWYDQRKFLFTDIHTGNNNRRRDIRQQNIWDQNSLNWLPDFRPNYSTYECSVVWWRYQLNCPAVCLSAIVANTGSNRMNEPLTLLRQMPIKNFHTPVGRWSSTPLPS